MVNRQPASRMRLFGSWTAALLTHLLCSLIERSDVLTEGTCWIPWQVEGHTRSISTLKMISEKTGHLFVYIMKLHCCEK